MRRPLRPATSPNGSKGKAGSKRQAAEAAKRTLRENTELNGRVAALTESLQVRTRVAGGGGRGGVGKGREGGEEGGGTGRAGGGGRCAPFVDVVSP